jgi:hypothetical protein
LTKSSSRCGNSARSVTPAIDARTFSRRGGGLAPSLSNRRWSACGFRRPAIELAGDFEQIVKTWLAPARHPRFKRPYTELVYLPMLELMAYLKQTDFARAAQTRMTDRVTQIPGPSRAIGNLNPTPIVVSYARKETAMRISTVSVLGLLIGCGVTPSAMAQYQCQVVGFPGEWGINSSGAFVIGSGESCQISIPIGGRIAASNVLQNPAHGRVEQLNLSNYVYVSEAGFRGHDNFVLEITGSGPSSSGTSRVSLTADVR